MNPEDLHEWIGQTIAIFKRIGHWHGNGLAWYSYGKISARQCTPGTVGLSPNLSFYVVASSNRTPVPPSPTVMITLNCHLPCLKLTNPLLSSTLRLPSNFQPPA